MSTSDWISHRKYCIVVDAGSSGSRIHVYSYKDPMHLRRTLPFASLAALPTIERGADPEGNHWQFKEEPGISTYGANPELIGDHVQPLLDFATSVVPRDQLADTPMYVLATAGVRLLPDTQRAQLLNATCDYIQQHSTFHISDCNKHVRAITGEEEGVFGWVAINYLLGGFHTPNFILGKSIDDDDAFDTTELHSNPASVPRPKYHRTFGFLDMGGASAQIAYEPTAAVARAHAHDVTRVYVRAVDGRLAGYKVYTRTFLGFGTNEAKKRYIELLEGIAKEGGTSEVGVKVSGGAKVVLDPCLNPGVALASTASTPEPESHPTFFRGKGDFDTCRTAIHPLLNKSVACPEPPCLFNGVHTPGVDFSRHRFVGVSEYWYSSHDVFNLGGPYYPEEYEERARTFCQRAWSDIIAEHVNHDGKEEYHTQQELDRLRNACFKAAWMTTVLHDGFGVPRDPVEHWGDVDGVVEKQERVTQPRTLHDTSVPAFQSVDHVGDVAVSWTLGAVLMEGVAGAVPDHEAGSWAWMVGGGVKGGVEDRAVMTGIGWALFMFIFGLGIVFWCLRRIRKDVEGDQAGVELSVLGRVLPSSIHAYVPITTQSSKPDHYTV